MAKLADLEEKKVIDRFFNRSKNLPAHIKGIGDDCAAYKVKEGQWQLVTTDALYEETHFLLDRIEPEDLGYKAMAVNLSDIAAMGGLPTGIYLSLALPESLTGDWLQRFSDGIFEICDRREVPVLGGDTTFCKNQVAISVTVTGEVGTDNIRFRSGASAGDCLCVTGPLGLSAAGLQLEIDPDIDMGKIDKKTRHKLLKHHYRPPITLDKGAWLGRQSGVKAMIDLSDGLSSDLPEMIKDNGLGVNVLRDDYPLSDLLHEFVDGTSCSLFQLAEDGGEDYELMLAVESDALENLQKDYAEAFDESLHIIGSFTDEHEEVRFYQGEQEVRRDPDGFYVKKG